MSAQAHRPETDTQPVPMAEHVRRLVETWPPLTPAQADRISVLLRLGGESQ
jgi:hypothetical protein